jgi:hypothetical protein
MRVKLSPQVEFDKVAQYFVELMKWTNDSTGYKEEELVNDINHEYNLKLTDRDIRDMKEKWNNYKYIGTNPTYSIYTLEGYYRRFDNTSKHKDKMDKKSKNDFLCAIQDRLNYIRKHDTGASRHQISMIEQLLEEGL